MINRLSKCEFHLCTSNPSANSLVSCCSTLVGSLNQVTSGEGSWGTATVDCWIEAGTITRAETSGTTWAQVVSSGTEVIGSDIALSSTECIAGSTRIGWRQWNSWSSNNGFSNLWCWSWSQNTIHTMILKWWVASNSTEKETLWTKVVTSQTIIENWIVTNSSAFGVSWRAAWDTWWRGSDNGFSSLWCWSWEQDTIHTMELRWQVASSSASKMANWTQSRPRETNVLRWEVAGSSTEQLSSATSLAINVCCKEHEKGQSENGLHFRDHLRIGFNDWTEQIQWVLL